MPNMLLDENIIGQIKELFDNQLVHPVEIYYFSKSETCETCESTYQLLDEVSAISELISLITYNPTDHSELAQRYDVNLTPSFVITGHDGENLSDINLRFAGIPSGYEFSSLIQGIILVSKRDSGLKPEIRNELKRISHPVDLKVFVTPTWPYCPQAVVLAHQMSMENPNIHAEMIEANEFYELARRYNVNGVPQTTINEGKGVVLGSVPGEYLLQEIKRAVNG